MYPVSAAHGYGVATLMDDLFEDMPPGEPEPRDDETIRVAVLGRPNAGKSSLINRILGMDRLVVSDMPAPPATRWTQGSHTTAGTTSSSTRRVSGGKPGSRRRSTNFSMIKALRSLDRCHVAAVLIDAAEGVSEQDARICGYALDKGKSVIVVVNKWDLIKADTRARARLDDAVHRQLQFISFAPRVNLSALTGEKVMKLFGKIDLVFDQFSRRLTTGELNRAVQSIIDKHPPPRSGRGPLKVTYATQTGTRPPEFVIFVNRPESIHFSYERFMINQLREHFGLDNIPLRLKFRKK